MRLAVSFDADVGDADWILDALSADPGRWLPSPARPTGPGSWRVVLHGGPLTRTVLCHMSPPWREADTLGRAVSWSPERDKELVDPERVFPVFDGEITLTALPDGVRLRLAGTYDPPLGPLGAAADRLGLHHLAEATARQFLAAVAANLGIEGVFAGTGGQSAEGRTAPRTWDA